MRRGGSPYNALSEGCSLGRADPPAGGRGTGDNTEMGTLAVTEDAKQQEAARKEAERAARKAPQDAAADAKGEAGEPASKKDRVHTKCRMNSHNYTVARHEYDRHEALHL